MDFGGCSAFTWQTAAGDHLLGRTYDQFGNLSANRVLAAPPGTLCWSGLRREGEGVPARYGYTGMAILGYGAPIWVDGVNGAGLMGALLRYPEYARYPREAAPGTAAVHPGRLLPWLLCQCAGLEEAVEALSRLTLVDEPIEGSPLAAHYLLSDRTGEAAVVEPDPEGLRVHRGTIGVLANSPDYLWQRTNLRNYLHVASLPHPPRTLAGWEARPFGAGMGALQGLPGDYSSPSRFVRLAYAKALAAEGGTELEGVTRAFRLLAPVSIPEGLAREKGGASHQTLCVSVLCAESGTYYFSPSENRRISAVRQLRQPGEVRQFDLGEQQDVAYRN